METDMQNEIDELKQEVDRQNAHINSLKQDQQDRKAEQQKQKGESTNKIKSLEARIRELERDLDENKQLVKKYSTASANAKKSNDELMQQLMDQSDQMVQQEVSKDGRIWQITLYFVEWV